MNRIIGRLLICSTLLGSALHAPSATAQGSASDKAAAEALYDEGRKLIKAKKYAEACDKLEQSQKLDPGVGTLLFMGECYEKQGRVASAWASFREAASLAKTQKDTKREKIARKRAERLDAKISKLTLKVPEPARVEGLSVTRNGKPIAAALWGTAIPVDPGSQQLAASAPGYEGWSTTVTVEGEAQQLTVEVPQLEKQPEPDPVEPPADTPEPVPPVASTTPDDDGDPATDDGSGGGQRMMGLIIGGVGVVGLVVGSVFGLSAKSKNDEANDEHCQDNLCNQKGLDLTTEAQDAATISTIGFAFGGLALAGGIALYLTAPSDSPKTAHSLKVAPLVGRRTQGIFVGGTF